MKKWVWALPAVMLWTACQEVPPAIDLTPPQEDTTLEDTAYLAADNPPAPERTVLMEEFTGVRCVTCPRASEIVHELDSIHGKRMAVIAYHVNDILGKPYSGDPDMRRPEGQQLYEQFWTGGSIPVGMIDRVQFTGESEVAVPQPDKWPSLVNQRLTETPPAGVKIDIRKTADSTYVITIETRFFQDLNERVYLSVAAVESGMIVHQKFPTYVDSAYRLEHVFRTMLTPWNGMLWNETPKNKWVRRKAFRLRITPEWKPENMHVVAFLHYFSAGNYEVLQADEQPLVP